MSVHLLVVFSLLLVLVPILVLMAVAWKELQLRVPQTRDAIIERAREDVRRRVTSAQVLRYANSTRRTARATLFTPRDKRKRVLGRTLPRPPVPSVSGARPTRHV
jgi:hypothetical protein